MGTLTSDIATSQSPASADTTFLPGPVLLLGAPGVGKGTQAQLLMAEFGIPQISTGDILRENIAKETDLGKVAKRLMDKGQLVPDEIVNDMVGHRLAQQDVKSGYILDGYPRTEGQAEWLDAYLVGAQGFAGKMRPREFHYGATLPLVAINIRVNESELLRRITGRRICSACKHIYNIYSHPPASPGICDIDGSALLHRSDDTEAAFAERMKAYESMTAPVIEHYRTSNRFREVNGELPVDEVAQSVVVALKELRRI